MRPNPPATAIGPPAESAQAPQVLTKEQLEAAYAECGRDLLAFLIGVLRDPHAAQDALQQTFQRAAESGGTARPENLRGWLFQVAYREAMLLRRNEQRDGRHFRNLWRQLDSHQQQPSSAEQLVTTEEVARLRQAISELPSEQQRVVARRIEHEETFAEIAANLNVPLGTVLTRMRLAMEKLRKRLRDE
jgi:RNA polymerase sigma-70 factor (ECF subfamily)